MSSKMNIIILNKTLLITKVLLTHILFSLKCLLNSIAYTIALFFIMQLYSNSFQVIETFNSFAAIDAVQLVNSFKIVLFIVFCILYTFNLLVKYMRNNWSKND